MKVDSPIRSEINALIRDIKTGGQDDGLSARFKFPQSFSGFDGHFPGNPVLPGVCQIQCAVSLLSRSLSAQIKLSSIVKAKFLNSVGPEEEILVSGTKNSNQDMIEGKFKISKIMNNQVINVSRIQIQCRKQDDCS